MAMRSPKLAQCVFLQIGVKNLPLALIGRHIVADFNNSPD
ncbi:hypothetical protein ACVJGD_005442 [Bradyrhizobium sp. USDA 10063]